MPKTLHNVGFPQLVRVKQKTDSHCGPAVLEMLCGYVGEHVTQNQIVTAAQVKTKLRRFGMNHFEMAKAINTLANDLTFWYKQNSTVKELDALINTHHVPVGVEWQGIFGKYADSDNGHYGVATFIDLNQNLIQLADPFAAFAGIDRTFTLSAFVDRWWDENNLIDQQNKSRLVRDERMMFIVTRKSSTFPQMINMVPGMS